MKAPTIIPWQPQCQESNKLFNLVTEVVVLEKVQKDLVEQSNIGQKLFWYIRQRSYPVREDQSMVDHEKTEASDLEIHS